MGTFPLWGKDGGSAKIVETSSAANVKGEFLPRAGRSHNPICVGENAGACRIPTSPLWE
jgi:hypothetical protein